MTQHISPVTLVKGVPHSRTNGSQRLAPKMADGSWPLSGPNLEFAPVTTATAIATVAKTTTSPEPPANTLVPIKFTNGNSAASPTVAFNGGAARAIQLGGVASLATELAVGANGVALFWFDGTVLHQIGAYT